jgi:hypothetical protein
MTNKREFFTPQSELSTLKIRINVASGQPEGKSEDFTHGLGKHACAGKGFKSELLTPPCAEKASIKMVNAKIRFLGRLDLKVYRSPRGCLLT